METKKNMVDETLLFSEGDCQRIRKSENATDSKKNQLSQLSLDINEILELELEEPLLLETRHHNEAVNKEKIKCCPTVLGGANTWQNGHQPPGPRTCSALHCRDCDLSVSSFPHYEWTERVEYLFLRTNMPNFEKVSEKLRRKHGAVAYACHCVSFSTEKLKFLHEINLPWFCRGHV